jgi:hypothetical protein
VFERSDGEQRADAIIGTVAAWREFTRIDRGGARICDSAEVEQDPFQRGSNGVSV